MFHNQPIRIILFVLVIFTTALSGCAPLAQSNTAQGAVPTPLASEVPGEVDVTDSFVDPTVFLPALIEALDNHDTANLQKWMTDTFLVGTWRGYQVYESSVDALDKLYTGQLGEVRKLEVVKDVDLKTLMGGIDPLSIPSEESGVMYAYLVSGWGMDAKDEAILFIMMDAADNLKWQGWMQIKGGFSGTRLGGIQYFENKPLGISMYLPKVDEVAESTDISLLVMGTGAGHMSESRAGVIINVEPANQRTAEQVVTKLVEETLQVMGAGYTGGNTTVLDIEGNQAYAVDGLPGQDVNRRMYIVHNDLLYSFMFVPDSAKAAAYNQMEDMYAMIVNTLHFIK